MDRIKENEIYDKFQDLCNSHKDIILSDDKHICNTECPLRDTNRCENVFFYQQGRADAIEELKSLLRCRNYRGCAAGKGCDGVCRIDSDICKSCENFGIPYSLLEQMQEGAEIK